MFLGGHYVKILEDIFLVVLHSKKNNYKGSFNSRPAVSVQVHIEAILHSLAAVFKVHSLNISNHAKLPLIKRPL